MLPKTLRLLDRSTPDPIQHALVGLYRNMAVAEADRAKLMEVDIMSKVLSMGVWEVSKDLLGSVQGGAIVLVKLLCKEQGESFLPSIHEVYMPR